jgi:hypothetical protein
MHLSQCANEDEDGRRLIKQRARGERWLKRKRGSARLQRSLRALLLTTLQQ